MAAIPQRIEYRGVMVVGITGAGKSSVANAILGSEDKFEVSGFTQSCTSEHDYCEIDLPDSVSGCTYRTRVMDTVGFFDTRSITNNETIKTLKQFMQAHFSDGVSLIIFVLKEGRFTSQEKECFDFIRTRFSNEISEISALVFTKCDIIVEEDRARLIEKFRTDPETKETAEFMKAGIYTVGFPQKKVYTQQAGTFRDYFEQNIKKDRNKLWDLIKKYSKAKLYRELRLPSFWDRCIII